MTVILIYILTVAFTAIQSSASKLNTRTSDNTGAFNAIKTTTSFLLFLLFAFFRGVNFHTPTIVCGMLYGILLSVSTYCGYMALALGAMSLTSMLVSLSVAIPVVYGTVFLKESLGFFKIAGLICLLSAIFFVNSGKKSASIKDRKKWSLYVIATFLCNGFSSVVQKLYQIRYEPAYNFEFMLFGTLVCCAIFIAFMPKNNRAKTSPRERGCGLVAGLTNGIVGYTTLTLAGYENASVLFPAISAGTILCALLCGIAIFKEKIKANQLIAVLFGITAVVLLKI